MKLNYEQIRTDGGTQPRSQLLSDVIGDYAEMMRTGVVFPPVTVYFDGKDYWLADGFHRLAAAKQARPQEPIEVEVIQGTQREAQWYSFGVNKCHGLRRTREDRIRAVKAALRHPQGMQQSDNEIARHVGVSHSTVAKYRSEMEVTCQIGKSSGQDAQDSGTPTSTRVRTGRDGRKINTAKIGRTQRRDPFKPSRYIAALAQPCGDMGELFQSRRADCLPAHFRGHRHKCFESCALAPLLRSWPERHKAKRHRNSKIGA